MYALRNQYRLHTSVLTKSKLWTTVHPEYNGTELQAQLNYIPQYLMYMGQTDFCMLWLKALPEPSFYGVNFNYQLIDYYLSVLRGPHHL